MEHDPYELLFVDDDFDEAISATERPELWDRLAVVDLRIRFMDPQEPGRQTVRPHAYTAGRCVSRM